MSDFPPDWLPTSPFLCAQFRAIGNDAVRKQELDWAKRAGADLIATAPLNLQLGAVHTDIPGCLHADGFLRIENSELKPRREV